MSLQIQPRVPTIMNKKDEKNPGRLRGVMGCEVEATELSENVDILAQDTNNMPQSKLEEACEGFEKENEELRMRLNMFLDKQLEDARKELKGSEGEKREQSEKDLVPSPVSNSGDLKQMKKECKEHLEENEHLRARVYRLENEHLRLRVYRLESQDINGFDINNMTQSELEEACEHFKKENGKLREKACSFRAMQLEDAKQELKGDERKQSNTDQPISNSWNRAQWKKKYEELQEMNMKIKALTFRFIDHPDEVLGNYVISEKDVESSPRFLFIRENAELTKQLAQKESEFKQALAQKGNELEQALDSKAEFKAEVFRLEAENNAMQKRMMGFQNDRSKESIRVDSKYEDEPENSKQNHQEVTIDKKQMQNKLMKEKEEHENLQKVYEALRKEHKKHEIESINSINSIKSKVITIEKHRKECSELKQKVKQLEEKCRSLDKERNQNLSKTEEMIQYKLCPDFDRLVELCKEIKKDDTKEVDLYKDNLFEWRTTILKAVSKWLSRLYEAENKFEKILAEMSETADIFESTTRETKRVIESTSFTKNSKVESSSYEEEMNVFERENDYEFPAPRFDNERKQFWKV